MLLYQIPDIRMFWTTDTRFHDQFSKLGVDDAFVFKPYSDYPVCYKDISVWIPTDTEPKAFKREFHSLIREIAGDLAESIKTLSKYHDAARDRHSHCYRVEYRSISRTLTNEEVNKIQTNIIDAVIKLGAVVR